VSDLVGLVTSFFITCVVLCILSLFAYLIVIFPHTTATIFIFLIFWVAIYNVRS
jgi:hypothetical protein